jgi:hypothetical protein
VNSSPQWMPYNVSMNPTCKTTWRRPEFPPRFALRLTGGSLIFDEEGRLARIEDSADEARVLGVPVNALEPTYPARLSRVERNQATGELHLIFEHDPTAAPLTASTPRGADSPAVVAGHPR